MRVAACARDQFTGGDFLICARTDAVSVEGLSSAIGRAKAYVSAGADMTFPDGLSSEAEFAAFGEELRGKTMLLANMTEFGRTPMIPVGRFQELGYQLVMFPVSTLRVAMKAVTEFLGELRESGTQGGALHK